MGIFATLSVLLYPIVANYVNSRSQSRIVSNYLDDVADMDDGNRQVILEAAYEYNRNLLYDTDRFNFTDKEMSKYRQQLNAGNGIMGVLNIEKIDVNLPIYHGTDEGVLQIGTGHLEGTSLPVGGKGTRSFLTGHRGLPSSKLLSDLDKMAKGNLFTIYIMGETITYMVDDIQTVLPSEVNDLKIFSDKDYCTLVTCTPYGINTHRLLVRGYRVENGSNNQLEMIYDGAKQLKKIIVVGIFMILGLPFLLIIAIIRCVKIYKKGRAHQ